MKLLNALVSSRAGGLRAVRMLLAWIVFQSGLLVFAVLPAHAEIFKWQDAQGNWHFSDSPKNNGAKSAVIRGGSKKAVKKEALAKGEDIEARLLDKYRPSTTVETVTLSVVGIETHLGQGSGFFVSHSGHIITNRHVVRPGSTDAWQDGRDKLQEAMARLEAFQAKLDEEKKALDDYAEKLADYKNDVEKKSGGSAKNAAMAEYRSFEARYQDRLENLNSQQQMQDARKREFDAQYSDFLLKDSMAGAARQFKVILKDNTELRAQLVKISSEYDLALLKLEGYRTPALTLSDTSSLRQGAGVFAVGSPLGMRDAVTSGIITSLKKDYLVTDAQILPGNSGGPLLGLEEGQVLGVNTLKFAQSALADGFGFAIPSDIVEAEFGAFLSLD